MRNMSSSDHLAGEPDEPTDGFRLTPRHIFGGVIALVLLVFIAVNNQTTNVSLIFFSADIPLWLALAVTALLGFGVGMMFGSRRAKAKYKR